MSASAPNFELKLAASDADMHEVQRLRYEVFAAELGSAGDSVDTAQRLERDGFDAVCDHLMLLDRNLEPGQQVVGVYRLLRADQAAQVGQFYSECEYDLGVLKRSGRKLLELGRSCVHRDYRGGTAMFELWTGLADYVVKHDIEVLFGVASFHGVDPVKLAHPLSLLHHSYRAPPELRVTSRGFQAMDLIAPDQIDRRSAMLGTPALIKAYLRLGGGVGEGAFVDHDFNTTDVCLVMDTARLNQRQRQIYAKASVRA